MKIRTVIPHDSTALMHVELMPDSQGEWDSGAGCIVVWFFETDMEAGKYFYEPHISGNVRLESLPSEHARAWGECLIVASGIAEQVSSRIVEFTTTQQDDEIESAWQRVSELREKIQGKVTA